MEHDWIQLASELRRLLHAYASSLGQDAIEAVEHYIAHDEYEMALEGLCLELMNVRGFSQEDRELCKKLSRELGLDRESVFDDEFWRKLNGEVRQQDPIAAEPKALK